MYNMKILPALASRWRSLALLLVFLSLTLTLVPDATAQGNDQSRLTVVAQALNVRSGPGVNHPAFDVLLAGDEVVIISYDSASDWWQVQLPDGSSGWVSGGDAYVRVSDRAVALPGIASPNLAGSGGEPTETLVFQTVSGGAIYAINREGSNLRYLSSGFDPALSPDGRWVAFTRWEDTQNGALGSLWVINVDGSGERAIAGNIHQPKAPTWSSDGSQIIINFQHGGRLRPEEVCSGSRPPRGAFNVTIIREDDGDLKFCYILLPDPHWGLRVIDVASGSFEDLPRELYSFSPTWDPVNAWRLVYDGDLGLVTLDLNLGTSWRLTDDVQDHSPTFSPDGQKIAVSYRQDDHWEIHTLNADGSGRTRLTQTSYLTWVRQQLNGETPRSWNNAAPSWSPDGSQIAFLTDRTGVWEIWVMNADGSGQTPMFPAGALSGVSLQYNGVDERVLSWR